MNIKNLNMFKKCQAFHFLISAVLVLQFGCSSIVKYQPPELQKQLSNKLVFLKIITELPWYGIGEIYIDGVEVLNYGNSYEKDVSKEKKVYTKIKRLRFYTNELICLAPGEHIFNIGGWWEDPSTRASQKRIWYDPVRDAIVFSSPEKKYRRIKYNLPAVDTMAGDIVYLIIRSEQEINVLVSNVDPNTWACSIVKLRCQESGECQESM